MIDYLFGCLDPFNVRFLAFGLLINDDPKLGQTQGIGLGVGRFFEDVVGDDDGRHSLTFQIDTVSHGAGGTGASSADSHQGQIGIGKLLDCAGAGRGKGVGLDDGHGFGRLAPGL